MQCHGIDQEKVKGSTVFFFTFDESGLNGCTLRCRNGGCTAVNRSRGERGRLKSVTFDSRTKA